VSAAVTSNPEETKTTPGKLCIFFGYHPLAGQTDVMLDATVRESLHGKTVLGCINRVSKVAAQRFSDFFSFALCRCDDEGDDAVFDIDEVLRHRPDLFFTDDPARVNPPGSRHQQRYRDIEELLRAGIDVYTSLDVQSIESLRDVVYSVVQTDPLACLPDSVFDNANSVVFVDIEPQLMKKRIEDLFGDASGILSDESALCALRELALRRAADRLSKINHREHGVSSRTSAEESILICLSASPSNARVIRTAARMADAYHGKLTALFVQSPDAQMTEGKDKVRFSENRRLAEQLGARIETVYGDDIAAQIADYANTAGVSRIVLGRSNNYKSGISLKPDLIDRLIKMAPHLDIHIIPDNRAPHRAAKLRKTGDAFSVSDALKGLMFLTFATLLGLVFNSFGIGEANIIAVYLLAIVMISVTASNRLVSVVASGLSVILFNFFFTVPRFTLQAYDTAYSVTFAVMLIVTVVVSTLTTRIKSQAKRSAQTAYRTQVLLEMSQQLQMAEGRQQILNKLALQLQKLLDRPVVVYPVTENRLAAPIVLPLESVPTQSLLTDKERDAALWVSQNNKHAGAGTDTLPDAACLYMAVRSGQTVHAVAGIALGKGGSLESFEKNLLVAMLDECALALEKERLDEDKNNALVHAKQEQLRANLLRAISHDLRTPLTGISGNASILQSESLKMDEQKKQQIYADIYSDAMWLYNLVENLLSVTRFDSRSVNLKLTPELIEEVITEAITQVRRRNFGHEIRVNLDDDLLMAYMDARLIVLVLLNILNNAVKYTPSGSLIEISARREGGMVLVEIADDGPGIPDDVKPHLFDMFYTGSNSVSDSRRGLGLGLALCKSIVTAHKGAVWMKDNLPKGSIFGFSLCAKEETPNEQAMHSDC
jgi:two-component system sensor histidine kinase KdpD